MSKLSYWQKRKAEFMVEQMEKAEDTAKVMEKSYKQAQDYLSKEADKIFIKYRRDFGLSEVEAKQLLKRAKSTDVQAIQRALQNGVQDENVEKLLAEMNSAAYASRIRRLDKVQSEIDKAIRLLSKNDNKVVTRHLNSLAYDAYHKTFDMLIDQTGIDFEVSGLDPKRIDKLLKTKWINKHYSEAIWDNHIDLGQALKEDLMVNYLTGRSSFELSKKIANQFKVSEYKARRLVRTESTFVEAEMEAQAYEEVGIEEYEYLAVLDDRTTAVCQQHNHKIYKVKDRKAGINYPPLHVFCRATTVPVFRDEWLNRYSSESFKTVDDPIREIQGSMFESHPEETQKLLDELEKIGVNVIFNNSEKMVYQPSPRGGIPGQISIYKKASYSALLHEYTHAMDDNERGWTGMSDLLFPDIQWKYEERAYNKEIELAKLNNLSKKYIIRLKKLKQKEYRRIYQRGEFKDL